MVHENIRIDLTNDMDPSKKLGNLILWDKMTKTEGAKIVSGLEKAHKILFKKPKSGRKKINLKKQKHWALHLKKFKILMLLFFKIYFFPYHLFLKLFSMKSGLGPKPPPHNCFKSSLTVFFCQPWRSTSLVMASNGYICLRFAKNPGTTVAVAGQTLCSISSWWWGWGLLTMVMCYMDELLLKPSLMFSYCCSIENHFNQPSLLAVIIDFLYSLQREVYKSLPAGVLFFGKFSYISNKEL